VGSRLLVSSTLALLIAAPAPVFAIGPGAPAHFNPTAAPPPEMSAGVRRAGKVLLIIGAVLAVPSAYLLMRAHSERNDLNSDASIADGAYGTIGGLASLATLTVGVVLWIPNDSSNPSSPTHPQWVQAPRGLILRFRF
jgi:hypothetical protein